MPRKNRTNSAATEGRRRASRKRRYGKSRQHAAGIPVDPGYADPAASTGIRRVTEGRILGVDFGERRIGLAVSDSAGLIAHGLETKSTRSTGESVEHIAATAEAEQVLEIVLGLPVNMDGTSGRMAEKVEAFAGQLRDRVSCEVHTWDERLTSISARRAMDEMGMEIRGNKGGLDRIAATIMLQNYLDARRRKADERESRD